MILPTVERALCVAAHPDDEILGAGATMAALADRGCEVHVAILGEGIGARFPRHGRPDADIARLADELVAAAQVIGAVPHQFSLPDNRFDSLDLLDVVRLVEEMKGRTRPQLVLTHHPGDMNLDHRVTCNAVLTAFRPLPGEEPVAIATFETLSSTEWNPSPNHSVFAPNIFVDATVGLERKLKAMTIYKGELRAWPHPRSVDGIRVLAQRRGMTVGLEAAEAFQLLRYVVDRP